MVPKSMVMFAAYEAAFVVMAAAAGEGGRGREDMRARPAVQAVAGVVGGCAEAVVVTPFQLVKVRLQVFVCKTLLVHFNLFSP